MKIKFLIISGLMIFIMSCSSSPVTDFFALFDMDEIALKHSDSGINSGDILTPGRLSVVDSFLVLYNWKHSSKHKFDVYSLNSKRKLHEYITIGGGPCEVPTGISSWRTRLPRSIEFDNSGRRIITAFSIGQPFASNICNFDTILNYSEIKQPVFNIVQMNDSIFILLGYFSEGRIGVFNSKTRNFKAYFNYPDSAEVKVDNIANKASVFAGRPLAHPDGSKFTMISRGDRFEIFGYKNNRLSVVKAYYGEMPRYRATRGGPMGYLRESKEGFVNGCATEKYIYMLYSTKTMAEHTFTTDCLFVFDWEGKPVQRYKLDVPTVGVFTNDDKTLYAIAEVGDDIQIVTFDLNHAIN